MSLDSLTADRFAVARQGETDRDGEGRDATLARSQAAFEFVALDRVPEAAWADLAARAIEPNAFYLPGWARAVDAHATGKSNGRALARLGDRSQAAADRHGAGGLRVANFEAPVAGPGRLGGLRAADHAVARPRCHRCGGVRPARRGREGRRACAAVSVVADRGSDIHGAAARSGEHWRGAAHHGPSRTRIARTPLRIRPHCSGIRSAPRSSRSSGGSAIDSPTTGDVVSTVGVRARRRGARARYVSQARGRRMEGCARHRARAGCRRCRLYS